VAGNILARAPVTLWLIGAGIVFSLLISVPLAVLAASRRDGLADHVVRLVSALGIGMPMFWVGIMLVTLVALPTGWFPVGGFGTTLAGHLRSMVLPGLTLGIAMAPPMIRGLRASIVDVLGSDYVSFGRSLGTTGLRMQRRFVLRNALPPVVTLLAVQSGYFLFGAVVLETAFALPGMGEGMVLAAVNRDLPLVQGYTLLFALAVVLVYLVADVVNVLLDPRVAIRA
jgi:peptide/nickel transport system permease protein